MPPNRDSEVFLVYGMRHVVTLALEANACTRVSIPLTGTLADIDLALLDEGGQLLGSDSRDDGAPAVEICAAAASNVHVVVRVVRGAGPLHLSVTRHALRASPRATRAADIDEEAFVDLDEPSARRTLRVYAAELSRRGFLRAEPMADDVVPESGALELPIATRDGMCTTVSIVAQADALLTLVGRSGERIATALSDGDLSAVQTCAVGAYRAVVRAAPGTRFDYLVTSGREQDIGGESGLWLGVPD